jgi:hypothetical protein
MTRTGFFPAAIVVEILWEKLALRTIFACHRSLHHSLPLSEEGTLNYQNC